MKFLTKFKMIWYMFIIGVGVFSTMGSSYMQTSNVKYVNGSSGSDSNNGLSISTSYKTIQKAVSNVKPGDTIIISGGTYNENIVVGITGNASAPILLTTNPGDTVVLNGGTGIALRSSGAMSYWTIDGLTIKSTNRYTLRLGWWGEPMTDHWTVKNNKIFGANYIMGSYHLWENNTIDGTGYPGTNGDAGISDGGDSHHNTYRYNVVKNFTNVDARGIWTQGKTHDSVIEYNTVDNIKTASGLGQCIDLDGAAQVEWRHTVRGNTVSNCSYVGIQLENVFASVVENNNIRNTGPAGIIIISYDAGVKCLQGGESGQYGDQNGDNNCQGDLTKNTIRQNVITTTTGWGAGYGGIINWYAGGVNYWGNNINAAWGNNNGGINIQGNAAQIKGNSIKDNIISQGNGPAICVNDLKNLAEEKNNLYKRVNSTKPYTSGSGCSVDYSISEFQTMTGLGQNTTTGDPAYKNVSAGDLRLSSISAAIDKGLDIGTTQDADGNTRLVGTSQDIGAYEYGSIVPTVAPTSQPTVIPTVNPTVAPTSQPTVSPSLNPTTVPTSLPTVVPTNIPTAIPTIIRTPIVTLLPGGAAGDGTYDDQSSQIVYTGSWLAHVIPGNYLNTEKYSNAIGSTAKFTFSGGKVTVMYRGYPKLLGKMGVKIDGVDVGTINQYARRQTYKLLWSSANLDLGVHTIVLTHLTGTYVTLDGITVSGSTAAASTQQPTVRPTVLTSATPTSQPTVRPTVLPSATPTSQPTVRPTALPSATPTSQPTVRPTTLPSATPTSQSVVPPMEEPTSVPTLMNIDNVGLGKPSDQSSQFENAVSNRAVDGNTDGVYANNSVTHTQEDSQSWWQVDLGNNYLIQTINVWTRTDCCEWRLNNFYILVSDQPFTSTDLTATINQAGVSNYYIAGNGGRPTIASINRSGRYVRVQLSGRDSLSLAEVQVIAITTPVTILSNAVTTSEFSAMTPTNVAAFEDLNTPTPIPTQDIQPTATQTLQDITQDRLTPTYTMEMTPTP